MEHGLNYCFIGPNTEIVRGRTRACSGFRGCEFNRAQEGWSVKKMLSVLGVTMLAVTGAQAQQRRPSSWQTEIGVRGGYSWFQANGLGHAGRIDQVDLVGGDIISALQTYGTLFAVFPWREKIAIEPSLSFYQATPPATFGTNATAVTLGLRGDYALSPHVFVAAGGSLNYFDKTTGRNEKQLGLQAAVGYRIHLAGSLNGRAEVQMQTFKKASLSRPYDLYSLLLGVSTGTRSTAPRARPTKPQSWPLAVGITGGYSHNHINGLEDFTTLSLPGLGAGGASGLTPGGAGPANMFVDYPLGEKAGLELGWDLHRLKTYGTFPQSLFAGQLAPRLNYALNDRWYAAAGAGFHFVQAGSPGSKIKLQAQSGVQGAVGYRFALIGAVGGRIEANYAVYKKRSGVSIYSRDLSTFSLLLGASMSLK